MIIENQVPPFDFEASASRSLVVANKSDGVGSRLRTIALVTAYLIATVGWLWFLSDLALWLIDF